MFSYSNSASLYYDKEVKFLLHVTTCRRTQVFLVPEVMPDSFYFTNDSNVRENISYSMKCIIDYDIKRMR